MESGSLLNNLQHNIPKVKQGIYRIHAKLHRTQEILSVQETENTFFSFQIWSGKWCIKDEHKLLSDLGSSVVGGSVSGGGTGAGAGSYYDTHNGFATAAAAANTGSDASLLYDGIATISQTQSTLYTPPIGASIGKL